VKPKLHEGREFTIILPVAASTNRVLMPFHDFATVRVAPWGHDASPRYLLPVRVLNDTAHANFIRDVADIINAVSRVDVVAPSSGVYGWCLSDYVFSIDVKGKVYLESITPNTRMREYDAGALADYLIEWCGRVIV
jgi:hypothetical protein